MKRDPALVSKAIVIWTGWREHAWPNRDDARLVEAFGEDLALELMPVVRDLADDFYRSDAINAAPDLRTMGDQAADEFRQRHPEIGDDAIDALRWCYTFDYK